MPCRVAKTPAGSVEPRAAHRHRSPVRALTLLIVTACCGVTSVARGGPGDPAPAWEGPLPVRGQFPLSLPFLAPTPQAAGLAPPHRSHLDVVLVHENTLQSTPGHDARATAFDVGTTSPGYDFLADGEITRIALRGSFVITRRIEVGGELPLIARNAGFMDSFIARFHELFGIPSRDRSARRSGLLDLDVIDGTRRLEERAAGAGIGDAVGSLKCALIARRRVSLSALVEAKAPTGDAAEMFGSGAWDGGISVLLTASTARNAVHASLSHDVLGAPTRLPLRVRDTTTLQLAWEGRMGAHWSLVEQGELATSPFPPTLGAVSDQASFTLASGARVTQGHWRCGFALCEDVSDNMNTPDLGVAAAVSWVP